METTCILRKLLTAFGIAMLAIMADNLLACALYTQPSFDFWYHNTMGQIGMYTYFPIKFIRAWLIAIQTAMTFPLVLLSSTPNIAALAGPLIAAPLMEELQFRGILLYLNKRLNGFQYLLGSILTSILFVMCHTTTVFHAIPIGTFALLSCWLIRKTGKLWPSMLLHCSYNLYLAAWSIAPQLFTN